MITGSKDAEGAETLDWLTLVVRQYEKAHL